MFVLMSYVTDLSIKVRRSGRVASTCIARLTAFWSRERGREEVAQQITKNHLAFMEEARKAFEDSSVLETYCNGKFGLIALRYGMDRDCIQIYELGEDIANFVQQMEPTPKPRKTLMEFAFDMEKQLKVNIYKDNWEKQHHQDLTGSIYLTCDKLRKELMKIDKNKHQITELCAYIANFAMMIADNEGQNL